ncbi:uncharacterized protein LOC124921181 isoform X1 [Impatiens glandulifera]|uniref:uncharacterized protein LOC124921181 isoform X1 n=1 Tax=Impatiens glandulifera TaxID=253017 RepID=UPI001FB06B92|nr:uncharacterized protein LOC124921181 isoform X1 [Impatiens glandulifera]
MEKDKDAFYVVKKGDVLGVYTSFKDVQSMLGSNEYDPSISVHKGNNLSKEAEKYLASHGLKNATYSVGVNEMDDKLFGQLVSCPLQEPTLSKGKAVDQIRLVKRVQESEGANAFSPRKQPRLQNLMEPSAVSSSGPYMGNLGLTGADSLLSNGDNMDSCTLEFDGASKGNPGLAGAGAILRANNGNMVFKLREGVGIATNNVAEYRAVILGLNYAVKRGCKQIRVLGDSKLVVMQVQGLWKTKNPNMAKLCEVAKELKDKFTSFHIQHIERALNSEADAQANLAVSLRDGEVQVECDKK